MLNLDHIISIKGVELLAHFLCISSLLLMILECCICYVCRYLVYFMLLLVVKIPPVSDMNTLEWSDKSRSLPLPMRKKISVLYVMCAHATTGGGFLPVAILSFSSRVFNMHGGAERRCNQS